MLPIVAGVPPVPLPRSREQGFTLTELIIALFVTVEVLVAVLLLFDFNTKLARVQTNVAEMQQSQRVAQYDLVRLARMAGRGGLPQNLAFAVVNNAPVGTRIAGAGSPAVVPGTDILQVRGVFSSPIYQVLADESVLDLGLFENQPGLAPSGTVLVSAFTPTGVPQDLEALREAIAKNIPEPLVLISSQGDAIRAVVELDPMSSVVTPSQITVAFKITTGTHSAAYATLSTGGAFSNDFTAVAYLAILEEYRFYVRQEYAVAGDPASDLTPRLARGRFIPGTDLPYRNDVDTSNFALDISDNVLDLQLALGFDTAQGGGGLRDDDDEIGDDDRIAEVADGSNDDWLFNGTTDSPVDLALWNNSPLYYIRVSTLVRTDQRDRDYRSPELRRLEDKDYTSTDWDAVNEDNDRMYRRRVLQTVVDLRNL
jgi:type II secretory pathway pseudopilin PulG